MADLLLKMAEALNSGYLAALEPRSEQNTTPTSIETFVTEEIVPRFQGKAASAWQFEEHFRDHAKGRGLSPALRVVSVH